MAQVRPGESQLAVAVLVPRQDEGGARGSRGNTELINVQAPAALFIIKAPK